MLASQLGYHVIQPIYTNDVAVDICQNDADPNAFSKFRLAIIQGGERPHKPDVPRVESLENCTSNCCGISTVPTQKGSGDNT